MNLFGLPLNGSKVLAAAMFYGGVLKRFFVYLVFSMFLVFLWGFSVFAGLGFFLFLLLLLLWWFILSLPW